MNSDKLLLTTALFCLIFLIWGLISIFGNYSSVVLPSPQDVVKELFLFFKDTKSLFSLFITLYKVFIATLISIIVGVLLGILLGKYKILDKSTEVIIDFIRSTPSVTLLPLFIMFFGINLFSQMLICFTIAIPIILINTKYGVINSIKTREKLAKLHKMPEKEILFRITLPEASPYIFNGIRTALSIIVILVIIAEMMIGQEYGIGRIIVNSQYAFQTAKILSAVIVIGSIGFFINYVFNIFEKKIFHWR